MAFFFFFDVAFGTAAPRIAFNEVKLFAFWLTALEIVEIGHAHGCIFGKCDNDAGKNKKNSAKQKVKILLLDSQIVFWFERCGIF